MLAVGSTLPEVHGAFIDLLKFMTGLDERMVDGAIVAEEERDELYERALSLSNDAFTRLLELSPHMAAYFLDPPIWWRPKRVDLTQWEARFLTAMSKSPPS